MARQSFLDRCAPAANIHPIPTDAADPDQAARRYERELKSFYGTNDNTDVTLITALPTLTPATAQTNDIIAVFRPGQSTPLQQATLVIQPIRVATAVFKNGGAVLSVGDQVALYFPMACTITGVALMAPHESGSAVVDIWKTPLGSFPAIRQLDLRLGPADPRQRPGRERHHPDRLDREHQRRRHPDLRHRQRRRP